jgi:acyl-CoA synthetase (AMP-forming)/AMP-acid ligase II
VKETDTAWPLTVTRGIRSAMTRAPSNVALRHHSTSRTYKELLQRIDQVTHAAIGDAKLRPGDHALIVAQNCIAYMEIVCGLGEAGVTVATITPRITGPELEAICDDACAKVVFADASTAAIARAGKFKTVERIIVIGNEYEAWLTQGTAPVTLPYIDDKTSWLMGYTSGTTGKPKGVLLSHRSRVLLLLATAAEFGCYTAEDRCLAITPLNHGGAMLRMLSTLFFGGTVELIDKFDAEEVMHKLKVGEFTSTAFVPTHFHAILSLAPALLDAVRPSHLKAIISHGAPLSQQMKRKIVAYFGPHVLFETYGSTEAGIVTCNRPKDQLRKEDSVGNTFPNTEIKIVNDKGAACGPGEIGELFSRSPYLFNGYWNKPAETRETLRDGWVSVGDLARYDEDGFVYIAGRKKDMIISGGINIYPREVEEILMSHPNIADAVVLGVSDDKWGQRLRAVIVSNIDGEMSAGDVIGFCQGKIASYKIPKDIVFTPTLPRNANGKVVKAALLQMTSDMVDKRVATSA